MLTNTDATLYGRRYDPSARLDVWVRTYLPAVWWYERGQASITVDGMKMADVHTVRIPGTDTDVRKDDFLVRGRCMAEVHTAKDLAGFACCKVTGASYYRFGGTPHIKAGGV